MRKAMAAALGALLTLLFPPRCPFCDKILGGGEAAVCAACRKRLRIIREPYCLKCGKALEETEREYCPDCEKMRHAFERGRILLRNDEIVKHSIYRFKYGGRKAYARAYVQLMGDDFDDFIDRIRPDAIVPVPLHFLRKSKRGYNQAALLAAELGRKYHIPVRQNLVVRCRNTKPQKRLDASQRQNNLKKAFKIGKNDVKLNTIILLDDIYTTGSTIDALSRVLKESGVRRIYFIALAGGR